MATNENRHFADEYTFKDSSLLREMLRRVENDIEDTFSPAVTRAMLNLVRAYNDRDSIRAELNARGVSDEDA